MVLVDSSHPEQMDRFPPEVNEVSESMMPSPLVMRLSAATGVLRFMTRPRDEGSIEPDIDDATHYIHHDRPDVVISAISDVVMAIRKE